MSKYIIEVPVDAQYIMINGVRMGDCYTQTTYIADIEELNSDYINEHYGKLQDTAYQKGFADGKAINDKGCDGCKYQANKELTCPCSECANNYKNQWKAKDDKIVVGDEVADKNGYKTIVTYIRGGLFDGLCSDGSTITNLLLDDNRKTGKHYDIDKILDEMKGNNDK